MLLVAVSTQSGPLSRWQNRIPSSALLVHAQIVLNYVAKTPNGKIFDNSLAKGSPYYVRVGSGAVVPGLDEALLSMQTGSIRRLYIPGDLAFPKGLASAPGRCGDARRRHKRNTCVSLE